MDPMPLASMQAQQCYEAWCKTVDNATIYPLVQTCIEAFFAAINTVTTPNGVHGGVIICALEGIAESLKEGMLMPYGKADPAHYIIKAPE